MDIINGRYEIIELVSTTTYSKFYKVLDHSDSKIYGMRIFKKSVDADFIKKFSERYFLYTKLVHPNILRDYRFDIVDGSNLREREYFYICEYINYDNRVSYTSLSFEERLIVLEKIIYALKYAHYKKMSYDFLTFSNINIFRGENGVLDVKLCNFGSVYNESIFVHRSVNPEAKLISMDIGRNQISADVFSFATVVYYLITAKDVAVDGIDLESDIKPKYPKLYYAILSSVGSYEYRPKSIDSIWRALVSEIGISQEFWDKKYYENIDYNVEFIGRREHLDKIDNMVLSFFNKTSDFNTVLVKSGLGIGKSRFLEELRRRMSMKGLNPVLCDRNIYNYESSQFGYFGYVVKELLRKFELSTEFIQRYGSDIVKIAPEVADKWNIQPSEDLDDENEINKMVSRVISFIVELSIMNNFVIILDDIDNICGIDVKILYNLMSISDYDRPFLVLGVNDISKEFKEYSLASHIGYIELSNFNRYQTVDYIKKVLFLDDLEAKALARDIYPLVHGNPKNIRRVINFLIQNKYIYVSENRKFEVGHIEINSIADDASLYFQDIKNMIYKLSDNAIYIAKLVSVYAHKFDRAFADEFFELSDKELDIAMNELIESKFFKCIEIGQKKYYDFYDYRVLSLIYINLNRSERESYHNKCIEYYESLGELDISDFDSYVFHLVSADNNEKAAILLLEKSRIKYNLAEYIEAIDYLNFADVILKNVDNIKIKLDILVEKSKSTFEFGDIDSVIEFNKKILDIADGCDFFEYRLNALINLCNLYLTMRRMNSFKKVYEVLNSEFKTSNSNGVDNDWDIKILRLRYLSIVGSAEQLQNYANELLECENIKENIRCYVARYYLAMSYYKMQDNIKAFTILTELINSVDSEKYPRQMIMFYRLMGEISHYSLYDDARACEYFYVAKKLVKAHGLYKLNCSLYLDVARVLSSLGKLEQAHVNYILAEKLAGETMQFSLLMEILNDSINLLISMGEYQMAESKIVKFERFFIDKDIEVDKSQYYYNIILRSKINLIYRKFDVVENDLDFLKNEGVKFLNNIHKIEYYILLFMYRYMMHLYNKKNYDIANLKKMKQFVNNPIEKNIFNDFLLTISINAYAFRDFEFYDVIMPLIYEDDTSINGNRKREFIELLNSHKDLKELKLCALKRNADDLDYIWKLYYIIGNIEYDNGNDIEALFFYYEAMNKYINSLGGVPQESKKYNIGNDALFNNLIDVLNLLGKKLYNLEGKTALEYYENTECKLKKMMIQDNRVRNIVGSLYILLNNNYLPEVSDYIRSLTEDNEKNIQNMLLSFTHLTLSEKGYVVIVDEDGNREKVFSVMGDKAPAELELYLSSIRRSEDFVWIKKNINSTFSKGRGSYNDVLTCAKNDKDILVFPICNREYSNLEINRKFDYYAYAKENIVAYVYLESGFALNQVNLEKLTEIRTYDGINSLVINNYNMYIKSSVDRLTGVFIRNVVEKHVDSIVKRMKNTYYPFSLFMIDIDKFKNVNDTYGHRRGDEILIKLGAVLKSSVRKDDLVGRYGGEEFIVVVNNVESEEAYEIAEKMRVAVKDAKLLGQDGELTVSIGVSSYPKDGDHFSRLVENADIALYESKRNGRNLVTAYSREKLNRKNDNVVFSGMFSTDASENAIKVKAMLDILALLSREMPKDEKIKKALEIILDVINGKDLFILRDNGEDICVNDCALNLDEIFIDKNFRQEIINSPSGGCFVDWDNSDSGSASGFDVVSDNVVKDWGAYAFTKVIKNGKEYATLLARSSVGVKEYSYKDYNYMLSLSPILAVMLDEE